MPAKKSVRRVITGAIALAVVGTAGLASTTALAVGPTDLPAAFSVDASSKTIKLLYNYEATETVVIPDGYTLDGNDNSIYAVGPAWAGAIIANDGGGSLAVTDLEIIRTIRNGSWSGSSGAAAISVKNGSLEVSGVVIEGVLGSNLGNGGYGILVDNAAMTEDATVVVEDSVVTEYNKGGIYVFGQTTDVEITSNVIGSGSPATPPNAILVGSGATSTIADNHIIGAQSQTTSIYKTSTGILLYGASDATIEDNTITATDAGIAVDFNSANVGLTGRYVGVTAESDVVITGNDIVAPETPVEGNAQAGIKVFAGKTGTLTHSGNTITGYSGDEQIVDESSPSVIIPAKLTGTPTPGIGGSARVGRVVIANPGTWQPAPVQLSYQWYRSGIAITGATQSRYTVTLADYGKLLKVVVTGKKVGYAPTSKTSNATKHVGLGALAKPTPTITGTAKVGRTLTAVAGDWGPAKPTLSYRWYRNGDSIRGATGTTYRLTSADKGKKITVKVTGTAPGYEKATVTSRSTSKVS